MAPCGQGDDSTQYSDLVLTLNPISLKPQASEILGILFKYPETKPQSEKVFFSLT